MTITDPRSSQSINLDVGRGLRTGIPEAVYAPGKTVAQICAAVEGLLGADVAPVIVTRCSPDQVSVVAETAAGARVDESTMSWNRLPSNGHRIGVVTAGVADQRVAVEAAATLEALGYTPVRVDDVGIAGIHRLLERVDDLRGCDALIVIAGMEGALATAVAGLVDTPIVGVPTSAGYGSSFDGLTALAAMTASCAPGLSVVGIDNGFGAACMVARWLNPDRIRHGAARDARS